MIRANSSENSVCAKESYVVISLSVSNQFLILELQSDRKIKLDDLGLKINVLKHVYFVVQLSTFKS